jgi:cytochrome P450
VMSLAAFIPGFYNVPTPANVRVWRQVAKMHSILLAVIAKRRAARAARAAVVTTGRLPDCGGSASGDGGRTAGTGPAEREVLLDFLLDAHDRPATHAAPLCQDGIPADLPHPANSGTSAGAADGAAVAKPAAGAPAPASSTHSGGAVAGSEPGLTDRELLDECLTFVLAGHETTSTALSWALYLLCEHPEWQARLREQVVGVLGTERAPTQEDVAAIPLVSAVLWEAMRLFPPVAQIVRVATRDVSLDRSAMGGGQPPLTVPAGTSLAIPIAVLHRDPALWPQPDEFNPLRFEHGLNAALRHPMALIPFSAGPRNCIGAQFALLEARLILAVLLQRCSFQLAPSYVHQPQPVITLRPRHGMPMLVTRLRKPGPWPAEAAPTQPASAPA